MSSIRKRVRIEGPPKRNTVSRKDYTVDDEKQKIEAVNDMEDMQGECVELSKNLLDLKKTVSVAVEVAKYAVENNLLMPPSILVNLAAAFQKLAIYPTSKWIGELEGDIAKSTSVFTKSNLYLTMISTSPLFGDVVAIITSIRSNLTALQNSFKELEGTVEIGGPGTRGKREQIHMELIKIMYERYEVTHPGTLQLDFEVYYRGLCNDRWGRIILTDLATFNSINVPSQFALGSGNDADWGEWTADGRFVAHAVNPFTNEVTTFRKPGRAAGFPRGYFLTADTVERYEREGKYAHRAPVRRAAIVGTYFYPSPRALDCVQRGHEHRELPMESSGTCTSIPRIPRFVNTANGVSRGVSSLVRRVNLI